MDKDIPKSSNFSNFKNTNQSLLSPKSHQKWTLQDLLLKEIILKIKGSFDLDVIKKSVVSTLGEAFDADRASITLYDKYNKSFLPIDKYSEFLTSKNLSSLVEKEVNNVCNHPFFIEHFTNNQILFIHKGKKNLKEVESILIENYKFQSSLAFPIVYMGKLFGVLFFHYMEDFKKFTKQELEIVKTITDFISIAIYQSELYKKEVMKVENQKLLNEFFQSVSKTLCVDEILSLLCESIIKNIDASRVTVLKINNEKNTFSIEKINVKNQQKPMYYNISNYEEIINYLSKNLIRKNNPFKKIDDIDNHDFPFYIKKLLKKIKAKSLITAPIKFEKEQWGFVIAYSDNKNKKWSNGDIKYLNKICKKIYAPLIKAQMHSELKKQVDIEKNLRQDDSILINKKLAKLVGLNGAITYATLVNKYSFYKEEERLDKNQHAKIKLNELMENTCLDKLEQISALQKLLDQSLIFYEDIEDFILFQLIEDKKLLKNIMNISHKDYSKDIIESTQDQKIYKIEELNKKYEKIYSENSLKAVNYFLKNSFNASKQKNTSVSRLYFSLIGKTFHDFMQSYELNFEKIVVLLDNILNLSEFGRNKKVSFENSPSILISRLKKTLLYRIQESKVLATDFNSKFDLYSEPNLSLKLSDLEEMLLEK